MSGEAPVTETKYSDEVADRSWIGRNVMVTYNNGVPWYDGEVVQITAGGDFVQVKEVVSEGWIWKREVDEITWHDVDYVYLIEK